MKNPSFKRASKSLQNQSSMQGRELEKESNIQQIRNPLRIAQEGISHALRNWEWISHALRNWEWISQPLAKFS